MSWFRKKPEPPRAAAFVEMAPNEIVVEGAPPFPIAKSLKRDAEFALVDWDAVYAWLEDVDEAHRGEAWNACERGWLLHLVEALGKRYKLVESPDAIVVSTLEPQVAQATLDYVDRTVARIQRVLDGVARRYEFGKEIVLILDDEDTYYRYVSLYYPDGEFAASGGTHINKGCTHTVIAKAELRQMEPIIAHELTHACLDIYLPLWLHEGLAVNTESRVSGGGGLRYGLLEMQGRQEVHDKHLGFWNETRMQAFWSGEAFHTPGDDSRLAYDLARVMVETMSKEWDTFKAFANDANWEDAGAEAARRHLGIEDLGAYVCALVQATPSPGWSPDPSRWNLNDGASSP